MKMADNVIIVLCSASSALSSTLSHNPAMKVRHVAARAPFYYYQRPYLLGDWGVLYNGTAMLLAVAWLLALKALGVPRQPRGFGWRWLALTVTPLHSWAISLPLTLLLPGPWVGGTLGSYNWVVKMLRRPAWDMVAVVLLMRGLPVGVGVAIYAIVGEALGVMQGK